MSDFSFNSYFPVVEIAFRTSILFLFSFGLCLTFLKVFFMRDAVHFVVCTSFACIFQNICCLIKTEVLCHEHFMNSESSSMDIIE